MFDVLVLTGRPASGKSEIVDFLTNTPPTSGDASITSPTWTSSQGSPSDRPSPFPTLLNPSVEAEHHAPIGALIEKRQVF